MVSCGDDPNATKTTSAAAVKAEVIMMGKDRRKNGSRFAVPVSARFLMRCNRDKVSPSRSSAA